MLNTTQPTIFKAFFRMNSFDPGLPSPPILTKFDEQVLKLCGDWGKKPTQDEFVAMLTGLEYQDIISDIYNALEHTVITPNADIDTFIAELSQIWFHKNGFTHIFCGDPKKIDWVDCILLGEFMKLRKSSGQE